MRDLHKTGREFNAPDIVKSGMGLTAIFIRRIHARLADLADRVARPASPLIETNP